MDKVKFGATVAVAGGLSAAPSGGWGPLIVATKIIPSRQNPLTTALQYGALFSNLGATLALVGGASPAWFALPGVLGAAGAAISLSEGRL